MARKFGSKGFTQAEQDVIVLGIRNGKKVPEIAKFLGRGRSAVYRRIERMIADGSARQLVADLGQADDSATE